MRSKILLFGLLLLAVGCDSRSGTKEPVASDAHTPTNTVTVAGAVEERISLSVAVPAGMEGLPVPQETTPTVVETPTAKTFHLPSSVSADAAHAWFSAQLPEGRSFQRWAWCSKRQDSLGVTWRWYRTDSADGQTLSLELGRDDRTGTGYVLTVVRLDHNPQTCAES